VLGTHSAADLKAADWIVRSLEGLSVTASTDGVELSFAPVA
jgi:sugar-phosphatase